MRIRRAIPIMILALALFKPVNVSADDFGFREYTYRTSACNTLADPMNFYYGKALGTVFAALNAVESILGLNASFFQGDQWFFDTDAATQCQKQDYNRANSNWAPREHTRLNQGARIDAQFTHITAGPIHHDVPAPCTPPDKADSFNAPRDWAAGMMQSAGYFAVYTWTGNNQALQQCDGSFVASDGYYVLARN